MISYADLERAFRLERGSPVLQKLPDDFYADARKLAASPDIRRDYTTSASTN